MVYAPTAELPACVVCPACHERKEQEVNSERWALRRLGGYDSRVNRS
jgi:hypothetical protein